MHGALHFSRRHYFDSSKVKGTFVKLIFHMVLSIHCCCKKKITTAQVNRNDFGSGIGNVLLERPWHVLRMTWRLCLATCTNKQTAPPVIHQLYRHIYLWRFHKKMPVVLGGGIEISLILSSLIQQLRFFLYCLKFFLYLVKSLKNMVKHTADGRCRCSLSTYLCCSCIAIYRFTDLYPQWRFLGVEVRREVLVRRN